MSSPKRLTGADVPGAGPTPNWYEVVTDGSLCQGDIFRDIKVFWPILPAGEINDGELLRLKHERGDFIVASASCDVDRNGYPHILLNKVVAATAPNLKTSPSELPRQLEIRSRGTVPSQHLLAQSIHDSIVFPLSIALHKYHALLPADYLRSLAAAPRLRLRSPHRERFGNWVASCFGRVGIDDAEQLPRFSDFGPQHVLEANRDE